MKESTELWAGQESSEPKVTDKIKGRILLGICGGIAAYKIPVLVSLLSQQGYRVRIVLSEAGARFVSREALEALSGQRVYSDLWQHYDNRVGGLASPVLHIALVEEADIFLLAPATYNWIGKAANGLADDLLSTLFAAWPVQAANQSPNKSPSQKPLLFAPAMNPEMWRKSVLQENVARLQQQGCQLIEPSSGFLACRAEGRGRMAEPEELYFRLESQLRFQCGSALSNAKLNIKPSIESSTERLDHRHNQVTGLPLRGKKILLTAGPTREALDPVRYISNRSSGRSGIALACAARDLGAEVTLISAMAETQFPAEPVSALARLQNSYLLARQLFDIRVLSCNSAAEMAQYAADCLNDCDWALAVAAVCDFRPARTHSEKIKKEAGQQGYSLALELTPDILAYWGQHKTSGQKVLGFALERASGPDAAAAQEQAYALDKLQRKNADAIVLNRPENLEGNCAQAQLFFAEDLLPDSGREPVAHTLDLQQKSEFATQLLLLLAQRWL